MHSQECKFLENHNVSEFLIYCVSRRAVAFTERTFQIKVRNELLHITCDDAQKHLLCSSAPHAKTNIHTIQRKTWVVSFKHALLLCVIHWRLHTCLCKHAELVYILETMEAEKLHTTELHCVNPFM